MAVTISLTFLVLMTMTILREHVKARCYAGCLSIGIYVFLMIRQGLCFFRSRTTEVKSHVYHIISRVYNYQRDLLLYHPGVKGLLHSYFKLSILPQQLHVVQKLVFKKLYLGLLFYFLHNMYITIVMTSIIF